MPTFQFNAGADWDVPGLQGVALNARMLRTGGQYQLIHAVAVLVALCLAYLRPVQASATMAP